MILGLTVILVVLLAALALAARRALSADAGLPLNADWIDELSVERYRPMMRLLDETDVRFLASQPGFTPEMASALRARREEIFRGYLRCLTADFRQVCTALKVLMLQSRDDRPDLGAALLRAQTVFAAGILIVQVRLFLWRWGLCGIDLAELVKTFDGMRLELRGLVPAGFAA